MLKFPLAHYPLSTRPTAAEENDNLISFDVTFEAADNQILLKMVDRDDPELDYIAVRKDTRVEIKLLGEQIYFSKDYDGITTKIALNEFYGSLCYGDFDERFERYKSLSFVARFNKGGQRGTVHPFNINIDLLQEDGAKEPRWIALSIDPDIKNPPPRRL